MIAKLRDLINQVLTVLASRNNWRAASIKNKNYATRIKKSTKQDDSKIIIKAMVLIAVTTLNKSD